MIKTAFKLLAILVIGILIYNYFLGTPSEQQGAKNIFNEFKDVGVAVKDLLKDEKEKFDSGKYDNAIDKIGDVLNKLKSSAKEFDEKYLDRISELDRKQRELKKDLESYKLDESKGNKDNPPSIGKDSSELKKELENLLRETEQLIKDLDTKRES